MSKRKTRQETGQHGFTVDLNESLYERFIQTIPVGAKIKVIASIALEMWCRMTPDERYDAMMLLGPDDLARKIEQAFALVAQHTDEMAVLRVRVEQIPVSAWVKAAGELPHHKIGIA